MAEPLVYLDTNVFIIAFESVDEAAAPARELMSLLETRPGAAATSELTLAELTAPSTKANALSPQIKRRLYFNLLIANKFIQLRQVTREILWDTANFRAAALQTGRKPNLPDAIHVVTAINTRCRFMVSFDARLGPLPAGMDGLTTKPEDIDRIKSALIG